MGVVAGPRRPDALKRHTLVRRALLICLVLAAVWWGPRWWCGWSSGDLYRGERSALDPIAAGLVGFVDGRLGEATYHTGSARFDGEWALVTCQMTVLGLGQYALMHPEARDGVMPAIEACLDWMVKPEAFGFGDRAWGKVGAGVDGFGGKVPAYLGYLNVALSMHRLLDPDSRHAALNDRLTEAFARRLADEPLHALETYPGETYPADLSTVVGSIGLYDKAVSGADHSETLRAWAAAFRAQAIDGDSGLVFQSLNPRTGAPTDKPRASGTAFSAYFLAFVDLELSRSLHEVLQSQCRGEVAGFGVVDEYPPGVEGGFGDIDSGPVIFGVGPSATAFSIAAARIHGDEASYRAFVTTAHLFGAPRGSEGEQTFLMGGPMGNALLFAMLTAGPLEAP